jgi:hypothetical protein
MHFEVDQELSPNIFSVLARRPFLSRFCLHFSQSACVSRATYLMMAIPSSLKPFSGSCSKPRMDIHCRGKSSSSPKKDKPELISSVSLPYSRFKSISKSESALFMSFSSRVLCSFRPVERSASSIRFLIWRSKFSFKKLDPQKLPKHKLNLLSLRRTSRTYLLILPPALISKALRRAPYKL